MPHDHKGRESGSRGAYRHLLLGQRDEVEGLKGTRPGCGDRWSFTERGNGEWGDMGVAAGTFKKTEDTTNFLRLKLLLKDFLWSAPL